MSVRDIFTALFIMAIWGLNFPIAKLAVGEVPPIFLMALRFALVALILVPFVPAPRGKFRSIFLLSVTFASLHFSFLFTALRDLQSSSAAIILQLQVPMSAVLGAIVFKDTIHWRRGLGITLGLFGVAVITGLPKESNEFFAYSLVFGSAFFWAVANIQLKRMAGINILSLNGWLSLFAVPQLLILSFFLEDNQIDSLLGGSYKVYGAIFYMAIVSTIIAYSLWYKIIEKYEISQIIPFTLLVPIYGIITSVFILGEVMTIRFLIGSLLTMAGVTIIIARRPKLFSNRPPRM